MVHDIPNNPESKGITVIVPVLNESESLKKVIKYLIETCSDYICDIQIIISSKTSNHTKSILKEFESSEKPRILIHEQTKKGLGAALREGLDIAMGSHAIIVYSDGESDLNTINNLITASLESPDSIISASRWLLPKNFENQGALKRRLNYLAQKVTALLFKSNLTDFTFGFRIYPIEKIRNIKWKQNDHAFVFESILRPIKLKLEIKEIPTNYKLRTEGRSSWPLWKYWTYALVLLLCFFECPKNFIKK